MIAGKVINELINAYCILRDRQYAVYSRYAKRHNLTTNELFVLDLLWFAPDGCTQKEICERLSANKQTIAALVGRFAKKGYVVMTEIAEDRRNKLIRLTERGKSYTEKIIPPAADADNLAMAQLGEERAAELVRLTTKLAESMENEFGKIKEIR